MIETQFVSDYILEMGHSRFCLCPGGWAPWSPRMIESLFIGCIPVILADDLALPASRYINKEEYLVALPQNMTVSELDYHLRSIAMEDIARKRSKSFEIQSLYNPYSYQYVEYMVQSLIGGNPK